MSGLISVTVAEAQGSVAIPADLDRLAVVMGCSSAGSGFSSFFLSGASAVSSVGYGDAVDTLTQIIEQRQANGASGVKFPAALYTTPASTAGSYGAIDNSAVTGTARFAVDATYAPYGTYEARFKTEVGGTIGTTGITFKWSLDGGRNYSNTTALGTAYGYTIPNSNVHFDIDPTSAEVTAFIAAVVEARADTLAHLADVTAHDAADTSAAQVALAASSAPTTAAQAWAVMNLCRTALASHEPNITAHNGPDPVNVVSHAAATNTSSGVGLYLNYKTNYNAHLGIALANSAAGLKAATATVASPVILTSADLLDAGEALLATYPRRLVFTTAGATASDAPATAAIVGTDYADAAQTETVTLAQTATTASSTKAWKTITTITYPAADGTGATIAIGYGQGVHNSADVTNTLTSTSPAQGTLIAGDTAKVRTLAPQPSTTAVDTAFSALAIAPGDFALLVCEFPCDATMLAHLTTGANTLRDTGGKRVTIIARTRIPDAETSETDAAWNTSVAGVFSTLSDDRIHLRATYHFQTDAMTTRQYLRSDLAQFAADTVRADRSEWPGAPADVPSGISNSILSDTNGALIGHDEGPRGSSTGLSDDALGNRFGCQQRVLDPIRREAVFNCVPWTLYSATSKVKNIMVRRIANAMERNAISAGIGSLGGKLFYIPADPAVPNSLPVLTETSRAAVQGVIFGALTSSFADDIQNADDGDIDTGLVQIAPVVTVSGGNLLTVAFTLAPLVFGYLLKLTGTFTVKE